MQYNKFYLAIYQFYAVQVNLCMASKKSYIALCFKGRYFEKEKNKNPVLC